MAIIIGSTGARPLLEIVDGRPEVPTPADWWGPKLAAAGDRLAAAVRAVARIDTPGAPFPFVGTAFAVAPRLAVTASYAGEALANRARDLPSGQPLAVLDFATEPPSAECAIAVERVEMIHPHWRAAFLVLDKEVPADRIARLAPAASGAGLNGREICVIGYPAEDARNPSDVVDRLFPGRRGIKRVMPGLITGYEEVEALGSVPMLLHDASTMGGTAGAPLIDLSDGCVLGLQYAGTYLDWNYAAPAWELTRDPQWAPLWGGAPERQIDSPAQMAGRALSIPSSSLPRSVFPHSRLLDLVSLLVGNRFDDLEDVSMLLLGLPPEMLATLPQPGNARARLTACLDEINRMTFLLGGDVPIYYVLTNAAHLRNYDPLFNQALSPFLADAVAMRQ